MKRRDVIKAGLAAGGLIASRTATAKDTIGATPSAGVEAPAARGARESLAAESKRVTVVTGNFAEQVERLLGDGSAFGMELRYARQPRPDGSADAVSAALAAGAEPPRLVATADTQFAVDAAQMRLQRVA